MKKAFQFIIYYIYKLIFPKKFQYGQQLRYTSKKKDEVSLSGFDARKCIFVHIPKAAGVSLNSNLFGNLGGSHLSIFFYMRTFSPRDFNKYYKFTVVRNPWDRIVSAYFFLKAGGFNTNDKEWFNRNLAKYESFEDFVSNWVQPGNIDRYIHFRPQYKLISACGMIMVDKVYKIENMNQVIEDLNKKLGTSLKPTHQNKTQQRDNDYKQYYNDKTRAIIEKVYRKDIELFNYKF